MIADLKQTTEEGKTLGYQHCNITKKATDVYRRVLFLRKWKKRHDIYVLDLIWRFFG